MSDKLVYIDLEISDNLKSAVLTVTSDQELTPDDVYEALDQYLDGVAAVPEDTTIH